jgi:hypothetical protein
MSMTRRDVIVRVAATTAALSLSRIGNASLLMRSAGAAHPANATEGALPRVLIRPHDETFSKLLFTSFPSYTSLPFASSLLPFTAVIRNGGYDPVKAYTYWWKGVDANGNAISVSRFFYSEATKLGVAVSASGANFILQPGELALVTPLFLWSASKYLRKRQLGHLTLPKTQPPEIESFLSKVNPSSVKMKRGSKIQSKTSRYSIKDDSAETLATIQNAERSTAKNALTWYKENPGVSDLEFATMLQIGKFVPVNSNGLFLEASQRWANAVALGVKRVTAVGMFTRINELALGDSVSYLTIPARTTSTPFV